MLPSLGAEVLDFAAAGPLPAVETDAHEKRTLVYREAADPQ